MLVELNMLCSGMRLPRPLPLSLPSPSHALCFHSPRLLSLPLRTLPLLLRLEYVLLTCCTLFGYPLDTRWMPFGYRLEMLLDIVWR